MAAILVVDDERPILTLLSAVLKMAGHKVLTASNGLEGLAVFRSYSDLIDLVITDLKMPVMDGFEMVARIQETRPETRIIVMSGFAEKPCPRGVRFLEKPFAIEVLRMCVDEILSGTRVK